MKMKIMSVAVMLVLVTHQHPHASCYRFFFIKNSEELGSTREKKRSLTLQICLFYELKFLWVVSL